MVGSSIYACRMGHEFAFTTTVEPGQPTGRSIIDLLDPRRGPGIVENVCELVVGTPAGGFGPALRWKADRLPKRLFGFSTIRLPSATGEPERLFVTGVGVRGHDDITEVFHSPSYVP
jgi:hypothetical protein